MPDFKLPELSSPAQVGELVGKPTTTLAQWRWQGIGPAYVKIGRSIRYPRADVIAWLEKNRVETAA